MSKLPQPNYTQVPNVLLDSMAEMEDSELRILLAATRLIVGFHKIKPEPISLSRFRQLTGMSNKGVRRGIELAIGRGWLAISPDVKGKRGTMCYELVFDDCVPQEHSQDDDCAPEEHGTMLPRNHTKEIPLKKDSLKKDTAPNGAVLPTEKKARTPDPIFDLIADKSFGLKGVTIDRQAGGRIAKVSSYCKQQGATVEELTLFYGWYDRETKGAAHPRVLETFAEYFLKFRAEEKRKAERPANGHIPVNERRSALDYVRVVNQ